MFESWSTIEPVKLIAAPENPRKGEMYFDLSLNITRYYDGTKWQPFT